ncbi:MBL fold metallo-hydrolase [Paenibacillus sp. GCM10027626]|uniref:MBL fold metallo-hydrolase n=1 Tax=Paenibacillus sp. GCM10027626 TaxID=3273411 RepID=UPI00363251B0
MAGTVRQIDEAAVGNGQIAVQWLGQAGYFLKSHLGKYIVIDPYLSDLCEHNHGPMFKRLMPAPMTPDDIDRLNPAAYLLTHHHDDHLDAVTISALKNTAFSFFAPPASIRQLESLGIKRDRCEVLTSGCEHDLDFMRIHGTFADHGELAPDAVGIVVELDGFVIYHMGDTSFHEEQFRELRNRFNIDLLIVPINGKYGNMNDDEAAEAVALLCPRMVTPCHYWMLPANSGGDPAFFVEKVSRLAPHTTVMLMQQGEISLLGKRG